MPIGSGCRTWSTTLASDKSAVRAFVRCILFVLESMMRPMLGGMNRCSVCDSAAVRLPRRTQLSLFLFYNSCCNPVMYYAEPFREPVPWKAYGTYVLRMLRQSMRSVSFTYYFTVDRSVVNSSFFPIFIDPPHPLLSLSSGLLDYPAVIKTPMDLGTIKKKIKNKEYPTLYKCSEDIRLVWSNCMTYNADGSDFFKLAEGLKKKWEIQFSKLLQDIGAGGAAGGSATAAGGGAEKDVTKVSLQDKRNMAKMLYLITKEDLGKVLVDIEHRCPAAIKRNATEDEIELNIDAITAPAMQELMVFLHA